MSTIVREINGIKGFCMYHDGQPYTYIYTRDAIEMLGLVDVTKERNKVLRINRFGDKFIEAVSECRPMLDLPVDYGISLTEGFMISRFNNATSGVIRRHSKYDEILPEYILDRVIFAIANKLHNESAEKFRFELFCNIIPHFQQTATQDQIAKVPILNQTSQFMYDNTNYQLITQQAYNFANQILDMHINRLAVLRNESMDEVFNKFTKDFNDILIELNEKNLIDYMDEHLMCIYKHTGIKKERSFSALKDTLIFNGTLYNEFISFLISEIREQEAHLIREINGETVVRKSVDGFDGIVEYNDMVEYVEQDKTSPVRFLSMDELANY